MIFGIIVTFFFKYAQTFSFKIRSGVLEVSRKPRQKREIFFVKNLRQIRVGVQLNNLEKLSFSPKLQSFIHFIYFSKYFSSFLQSWSFFLSKISLSRGACKLFFAARRKVGYQTGWVTFAANFRNQNKKRALQYTFPLKCFKTRETRWRIFRHVVGLNGAGRWGKADRPKAYGRLMRIFTRSQANGNKIVRLAGNVRY